MKKIILHLCAKEGSDSKPNSPIDSCEHGVEARLIYPCNECIARLNNKEKPDPVEEKIDSIAGIENTVEACHLRRHLRELVELARKK